MASRRANLYRANLRKTNLSGADLGGANLEHALLIVSDPPGPRRYTPVGMDPVGYLALVPGWMLRGHPGAAIPSSAIRDLHARAGADVLVATASLASRPGRPRG